MRIKTLPMGTVKAGSTDGLQEGEELVRLL